MYIRRIELYGCQVELANRVQGNLWQMQPKWRSSVIGFNEVVYSRIAMSKELGATRTE